jgi:hypothetical protein
MAQSVFLKNTAAHHVPAEEGHSKGVKTKHTLSPLVQKTHKTNTDGHYSRFGHLRPKKQKVQLG